MATGEGKGWVKIYRQIMDAPGYCAEPFCRNMAWVDMLLLANHSPGHFRCRGIRVEINRGQIGYGLDELAKRWRWSRGKVERFMKELETDKQIVRQKNNVTTLITIVNYEEYQGNGKANDNAEDKTSDKANEQQTVMQTDVNKNVNNYKKGKNRANALVVSPRRDTDQTATNILKKKYAELAETLKGKDMKDIMAELKVFVTENKPDWIEPYVDLWNIVAHVRNLPQVETITDSRRKKFKTRICEASFDFIRILEKIKHNRYLLGDNQRQWKVTFDWILENDSNYNKILEEQY